VSSDCGKLSTRNSLLPWSLSSLKGLAVSWAWPRKTDSRGGTNGPLRKALLSPQLSARDATLAEGLAELLEQFAESTAARVAELVNEHRAPAEPRYYTTAEAADYLRCCVGRIYNLSSQGRLKGRKDGGGPAGRSARPALPSLPAVPAEATPHPPVPPSPEIAWDSYMSLSGTPRSEMHTDLKRCGSREAPGHALLLFAEGSIRPTPRTHHQCKPSV
jgi:hypothetical protein